MRLAAATAALLALSLCVPALETPLILPNGNQAMVIDAARGQVRLFEVQDNGVSRRSQADVRFDLEQLERRVVLRGKERFSQLRMGTTNFTPTAEEFLRAFPKDPSSAQKEAGKPSTQDQVRSAEDAFWAENRSYDGNMAGAFDGRYLMMVLPSHHTLLFYENVNDKLTFSGAYNYGPLLYVQTAWNSLPSPSDLLRVLDIPEEQKKALSGRFTDGPDAPKAAKSTVWCTSAKGFFAVLDTANQILFSIENTGRKFEVRSVRSIAVDLLVPSGYNALPNDADVVTALTRDKERTKILKEVGIEVVDIHLIRAAAILTAADITSSDKSGLQANLVNGQLMFNFVADRKLLAYELQGTGNSLELKSVRDGSVDAGVSAIDWLVNSRLGALKLLKEAEDAARQGSKEAALAGAVNALNMYPPLHAQAAKSAALNSALKDQPAWPEALTRAAPFAEQHAAKIKAVSDAADQARDEAKNRKK